MSETYYILFSEINNTIIYIILHFLQHKCYVFTGSEEEPTKIDCTIMKTHHKDIASRLFKEHLLDLSHRE